MAALQKLVLASIALGILNVLLGFATSFRKQKSQSNTKLNAPAVEGAVAETIDKYFALQKQAEFIKSLDAEDMQLVESMREVERTEVGNVVLYSGMSPMIYILAWLLHGVVAEQPLKWADGDSTNSAAVDLRAFDGANRFPSFNKSATSSWWGPEIKNLQEQNLKDAGVQSANDFINFVDTFNFQAPDAVPGVRERLMSVNINLLGNEFYEGPGESSFDIFRLLRDFSMDSLTGVAGTKVPFLHAIFESLSSSTEVRQLVVEQLRGVSCVYQKRTLAEFSSDCEEILKNMSLLFSPRAINSLNQLVFEPKIRNDCHKEFNIDPYSLQQFRKFKKNQCGTGVMLQLVLPPKLADHVVYACRIYGAPLGRNESFSRTYVGIKNTEMADILQARVLMLRELFTPPSDGIRFVAHSSMFLDGSLMKSLVNLLNDVRETLMTGTPHAVLK